MGSDRQISLDEHRETRLPRRTKDLVTKEGWFVVYDRVVGEPESWRQRWVASDTVLNVEDCR